MVISETLRKRVDAEIARFPQRRGGLLGALRLVQDELGCISLETGRELAEIFEIAPVDVMELVHFYNMLRDAPQGRHQVYVCTNLSCSLLGANGLLRGLESHLGVRAGETTADGRVHLGREECLGACAYAPMMRIGETYYENLDLDAARAVIDALE
jgi:NADH-quinone oxidoreductase subunit E